MILASHTRIGRSRTRRRILDLLKTGGAGDARSLASRLKISPMAVRQHLYALRSEGAVSFKEETRPRGRPARIWCLERPADRYFPDGHSSMLIEVLAIFSNTVGEKLMESALAVWARTKADALIKTLRSRDSYAARLRTVLTEQNRRGFMAEVNVHDKATDLLRQNHCPVREAATECRALCEAEKLFLQHALGRGCVVERAEHIFDGSRCCVYRIRKVEAGKQMGAGDKARAP